MTRRLLTLLLSLALVAAAPAGTRINAGDPPPGDISDNVEFITNVELPATAIGAAFIDDTMFVSTVTGIYSYDVADPTAPELLGVLPMYIWENEDVDVDAERGLLFISRDPRGFTGIIAPAQARFFGAVHIIDVNEPRAMAQVGFFTLPAGHTSTCVSAGEGECDFLWTGGPYGNEAFGPYGRPIYATDVRDPLNPVQCPEPLNTGLRPDGGTGYAHDVQVDHAGVAWVSSEGGVHGYWTHGTHVDPTTGVAREATPCDPVPYGGGVSPTAATPSRFMHNAWRSLDAAIPGDEDSTGHILWATEENVTSSCAASGRFATYDLRSSLDGSGFTDPTSFEMKALDSWTPEGANGADGCASAHYFDDRGDDLLAYSFYGQGTRFLDVSDPRDIRQVGYFRPDDANVFATYWHEGYVFVADFTRGIDVLRFTDGAGGDVPSGGAVALPTLTAPAVAPEEAVRGSFDPATGYVCVLQPLPGRAS